MRRDRENELDLADVGGEANTATHGKQTPAGHIERMRAILTGTNKELKMPGNPRDMIVSAERRFPVRIRIGVPRGGFGQRYTEMTSWLDENCGADGWAMTPSGMRGVLNDAVSIYFLDATLASAFVARWCAGYKIETAEGGVQDPDG
jgi:hypothetical protein